MGILDPKPLTKASLESNLPTRLTDAALSATYALKGAVGGGSVTFVTLTSAGQAVTIPSTGVTGLALTQDATGSRTVAWPTGIRWDGGVVPTLATAAGSTDVFTFVAVTGGGWLGSKAGTYGPPADSTAPSAVTGLTAGTATATTVPLSWTAATDNIGIAGYEYSTNGTTYTATGSTGTSYTVTGLTASTAYTFHVRAFDAAGNRGTPVTVTKTTAAPPADSTAPSAVTGLTAGTPTATTIPLSWTAATDNVAVTGYEYTTNGTNWVSTGSIATSYTVTGLTQNTAYTVQVRAFDAAGNRGTAASVTATTAAAATYSSTVLADSPLHYLALADAAGTTTPAKQGSGTATWTATAVTFGVSGLGDGATAADFNGTTSNIVSSAALPAMPAGSVAILVDRDNTTPSGYAGDIIGSTAGTFALRFYQDKIIAMRTGVGGGSGYVYATATTIAQNTRALIEFTWDSTGWVAYLNGTQSGTGTDDFSGVPSVVWKIGYTGQAYLDGQAAGAAIFTTKQTAARALARAQAAGLA